MELPQTPAEPNADIESRRHHDRVIRNGFVGAACSVGFVLLGAGAMFLTLVAGGLLVILAEPAIIGIIGVVIAVSVSRRKAMPGFAPGFLMGLGVSLLILCGTCYSFFSNLKL